MQPTSRTPAIRRPDFLFATGATRRATSLRSAHTLQPLSESLGIPISTHFHKGDEAALAEQLGRLDGTALVAWEHHKLPELAGALLGDAGQAPREWPDDRYDVVWVFERANGGWHFSQAPMLLLAGDRPDPL